MAYIYDIADTWAASGTTFTGIKLNVTDTASAAGSLLMDLQVGGASRFSVAKDGIVNSNNGFIANLSPNMTGFQVKWGIFTVASMASDSSGIVTVSGDGAFRFSSSALSISSPDVFLRRDAANTLAQRNGVNAQAFNLYQSYTDASNYTRGRVAAASGIVTLAGESAGTGAADIDIAITPKGTGRVRYGTHAAIAAETVTGYVEIKDAGGTVRKIAVVS